VYPPGDWRPVVIHRGAAGIQGRSVAAVNRPIGPDRGRPLDGGLRSGKSGLGTHRHGYSQHHLRTASALVAGVIKLVSLPDIYWRVKGVIDNPDSSAQELSRVISTDPAISARLLSLVNSAFWDTVARFHRSPRSDPAGIKAHSRGRARHVDRQTFKGFNPKRMDVAQFWRGSVYRALAAASLARKTVCPMPKACLSQVC